jgi:hypothetical protein
VGQRRTSFGGGAAAGPFGRESSSGRGASALQRIGVQPAAANAAVQSPRTDSAHAIHFTRGGSQPTLRWVPSAAEEGRQSLKKPLRMCVGTQGNLRPRSYRVRTVCLSRVYRVSTACSHAPTEWAGAWRLWRGIGIGWRGG